MELSAQAASVKIPKIMQKEMATGLLLPLSWKRLIRYCTRRSGGVGYSCIFWILKYANFLHSAVAGAP